MIKRARNLYQSMMEELAQCKFNDLEYECRFSICNRYWAIVQNDVSHYVFEREEEEIEFFKIIKPQFVSEMIYCGLCSYGQLFKEATTDLAELKNFWKNEFQRLEKFKEEHAGFYEYYSTDQTASDAEWFTRKNNDNSNIFITNAYDLEHKASSSHDVLISNILALQRYNDYVRIQLQIFQQNNLY